MKHKISSKAFEDIENIWLYAVEIWSMQQADRYYNLIFDEIEDISENSLMEKDYENIRKGYRCSKVKSHLIFYKYNKSDKTVEIIRILHQSMDIEERLKD